MGKEGGIGVLQGYEPFGSLLPGRNYSAANYRWGFNGVEKDDEIYGSTGTSYAFEYRMHDPRVGRFLSLDPLSAHYPWNSPYAFAENSVIRYGDLEGLERGDRPSFWGETGLVLAVDTDVDAEGRIMRQMHANEHRPPPPTLQEQMANRQHATIGVPDRVRRKNAQAVEFAENIGLADGMRVGFGQDHTGEVSTAERWKSAGFIFLPNVVGKVAKPVLRGFERLAEVGEGFYKKATHLAPGERVAHFRNTGRNVAGANNWARDSKLSKQFNRDVYRDADKNIYSLDTQHGHFELLDSKGKHQGAIDFHGERMEGRDVSGSHDLDVK